MWNSFRSSSPRYFLFGVRNVINHAPTRTIHSFSWLLAPTISNQGESRFPNKALLDRLCTETKQKRSQPRKVATFYSMHMF